MAKYGPSCEILSREIAFRGAFIELSVDRVRTPAGGTMSLDVVRHPGSVVLIAMPDPGQVWLVHQYRHAIGRTLWELPAGRIEPGEAPETAAERECCEEIGWRPGRLDRLGAYFATPGYCDELMVFFRASALTPYVPTPPDPSAQPDVDDERLDARLFPLAAARRLLDDEAADLKTALGLGMLSHV